MRGVHDGTWDPVNADTDAEKIALLEEIIDKQREILSQETGKPAEEIPQVFIPYKEIADLYNKGIDIPDDVTIMFTNDNYGYVRQGMTEEENARSGGGGIYYHVSYHGRPSDLLWNGSTQLGLIKEEMTKAYDSGADTIWLLNVGPLKPFENQMEYFLDLGRNIDELRDTSIMDYVADNAQRYFGFDEDQAREYAAIQCERLELVNGRRPEFYEQGLFSLTSYGDEGQKIIDAYADLLERSEALYDSLPAEKKAGYYELQHYAVKSAYNIAMNYINADRSVLYKEQGRGASVNKYAELSEAHGEAAIEADIAEYETIENGKWTGMIDPFVTKNGLNSSWNFAIASAEAETVTELPYTEMGVAVEDQQDINTRPALEFSGYTKDVRFIDIFNKGTGSFDWKASADADWIIFNKESGTVYDDDRIYAGIDWDSAPEGESTAVITITRYIGETAVASEQIEVKLSSDVEELPERTYAEANGYVSIEAEHYTASVSKSSGESSLTDGVVTGSTPSLITDASGGIGFIAVYGQDGTLSSVQLSETYSDGAYIFDDPVEPAAGETVKGMVWSSFEEMKPLADAYGLAEEKAAIIYEWQEQDDFGRSGTSMKFMPNAAESISDNSAYLEYDVNFESTGTFNVDVYRMPTLNERGSVKFAVGIDGEQPSELTGNNDYYASSSSPHTGDWAEGILNNNETLTATVTVNEPGIHTIKLYGIDPGAAVDKIVITTGTKYDSYYGAPESYNTTYNNAAAEMPEPSEPSTEIAGDVTALFTPQLYTAGINLFDGAVTGVDILKLTDIESAQVTVAAYDGEGIMLSNATVTGDFSGAGINEKVTVPVSFGIPQGAAELQVIAYDNTAELNALAPAYTADTDSVSLMAAYDSGVIEVRSNLDQYMGKEALCLISNDETGEAAYIRQETVGDKTFKTIKTGELDGTYSINVGVAGEGVVITEKAYTAVIITPDNEEKSETLYSWNFSDASQTASEGSNIPVLGGKATYDSKSQAVKMPTLADKDEQGSGSLNVTLDEPVKTVQGEEITVVSKIAYGRQGGSFMDYTITDSNGKELFGSHICVYSSSGTQSLRIGGYELLGSGLPAGIVTSNKNNDGYQNGYSTFTVTLSPDTNTITLTVSNDEGETTYTGSFPEGTSYDVGELSYAISRTYTSRSCYVDDISITKTKAPSYTMDFDVKDTAGNAIENAAITVTDGIYGGVIKPESDGTYDLCDGIYSYTVTADGYDTVTGELELTPAAESKTISVTMEGTGTAVSPSPSASPEPSPSTSPEPSPSAPPASDYDNTAGYWKFDFGADAADGYIGVSADKSFSDDLTYGFIGIKEEDYKLSSGEYMDGFRMLEGQKITLANGSSTRSATLENDGERSYAQLTKSSSSGSYVVYRAFDSAVSRGKIILETDLYYESGRVDFILSNKTNAPNNGYAQRITAFKVNNGTLYDSADNVLGEMPENEWVKVRYVLDMDYGTQTLTIGDNEYGYAAAGMDSINSDNITVSDLQQLNIAGSGSSTLSARITNTSVKTETNGEVPDMTLTLIAPDSAQGTVSIADSSGLTKTAAMNSIVSVSAIPNDGYIFVGWFDENNEFVSGNNQAQIRLHRDVRLTAVFEADDDPIEYAYRETFTALSTSTLAANGWVSDSAQSYLTVRNDNAEGTDENYLYFNPNRGSRNMSGAFTLAERVDERYIIEMDFGISNGSGGDTAESEFTLMTSGTISATNRMVSGEYLLKLNATEKSSGSSENSMTWSINDGVESTVTLEQSGNNPVWAHLKLTVDPETGTAQLVITQNGEEKYNGIITMGVKNGDYSVTGLHFYAGRQYSKCQFDNIRVYSDDKLQ